MGVSVRCRPDRCGPGSLARCLLVFRFAEGLEGNEMAHHQFGRDVDLAFERNQIVLYFRGSPVLWTNVISPTIPVLMGLFEESTDIQKGPQRWSNIKFHYQNTLHYGTVIIFLNYGDVVAGVGPLERASP